ncbi:MAG: rod shape-determining protein MreC [Chitinophagales bacterium]|nr:rod shape-determining protein MreC [Chitinophagales bacterium]
MRTLFDFIIRFNYVLVFLILEAVSFFFVIRNHSYQRTGFLNSAGVVTGNIYNTYFKFSEYLNLGKVNEDLKTENATLREHLQLFETAQLPNEEICDTAGNILYEYIPVKAINFSTNRINNYITLNKGSNDGIAKDMGVVTDKGVVGIVNKVSANFSTAMSVLHKDCRVSVKIKRFNYPGTLQWSGGSPQEAELIGIPQHLPLVKGDSVLTSGFSAIFPENIPVGIISDFYVDQGSSFYMVVVQLAGGHETLQFGYVVNNLYQQEQRELEQQNEPAK